MSTTTKIMLWLLAILAVIRIIAWAGERDKKLDKIYENCEWVEDYKGNMIPVCPK